MLFANKEQFEEEYLKEFPSGLGRYFADSSLEQKYKILVDLILEKIGSDWVESSTKRDANQSKQVFYFSMEFLTGKLLDYYLLNLGIYDIVKEGLADLNIDLAELSAVEPEPGLGNGGLGRLAACFMDSMAYLGIAGQGQGIRYKYGFFHQKIIDGYQAEMPDNWLNREFCWEIRKPEEAVLVKFNGHIRTAMQNDRLVFIHEEFEPVLAVPYDVPVIGYEQTAINTLRLWSSEPVNEGFDFKIFNSGDFYNATRHRSEVETISYVLYPENNNRAGLELRLKQEYLLVAAGVGSIVKNYLAGHSDLRKLDEKIAIHINDTHPALVVCELMRILMDDHAFGWDEAWSVTTKTVSYTNHTIMPEAMEKWEINLFKALLPRIYLIVEEVDRRHRETTGLDEDRINQTAVLYNGYVNMANLAIIGSYSVNGVAALHSQILQDQIFPAFYKLTPEKFNNKTNGMSHRRFLLKSNPKLSRLISETIGSEWIRDPMCLKNLLQYREDSGFLAELGDVKYQNKVRLSNYIKETTGRAVDPHSVFDIQVKRIHAYKRQLLNVLKIMDLYNNLKDGTIDLTHQPAYTFVFAGKSAPGYYYAKNVIKLITSLADKVNADSDTNEFLKVVFLENFNVSSAELIYPATDISEQISTASKEASGTSNMKCISNGAIILGTMDGANVEIAEFVGRENMAIFGLTAEEVIRYQKTGSYSSWQQYHQIPAIKRVVDQLINGFFPADTNFWDIYNSLLIDNDPYFILQDFPSYLTTVNQLNKLYLNPKEWQQCSLMNIANSGFFSSDRTIKEYADEIWKVSYAK